MPQEPGPKLIGSWVQDAQGGDREAFDRLARHFLPRIRRWALVRTGDPDDADEVVQRTLVQAYQKIRQCRAGTRFGSWLYTITSNTAKGLSRTRAARVRALGRLQTSDRDSDHRSEPTGDEQELSNLVRAFLRDLTPRQREMMDLVDLQGLQPGEAAARLGLAPATARVHLLRARRKIRSRLLGHDPSLPGGAG